MNKTQVRDIIDCLLFSSSPDICADWNDAKQKRFVKLAKQLSDEHEVQPSKDIYLFGDCMFEVPWSEDIRDQFPKLRKEK